MTPVMKPMHHARPKKGAHHPRTPGNEHGYWLYGTHAVTAALANPQRRIRRLVGTAQALAGMPRGDARAKLLPEAMDMKALDQLLGSQSVHQGIAVQVEPLPLGMLEDVLHILTPSGPLLVLDQVSDPHNVGAILRSAAAFGAVGVLTPKDHSAPESAVMAKAASGALDLVPRISVTNLAAALRELKDAGWWITGLSGDAKSTIADIRFDGKTVLVLGAEGKGMRRLTADLCDHLVRLPMRDAMESLNVSNAAAIALYECYRTKKVTQA